MSKLTIPAQSVSNKNYIADPAKDTAILFPYIELSGIWKCAIDLCLLWSETPFFPRISLHRLKTTKNPVYEGLCRSHGRAGGQKPGFFENLSLKSVI
ncbi:hypothetical protein [Microcoleus sp. CAWBG58]|uniref:hypothetical protein n=1 Tax=Microcoleus sp. CAWBG58 TaxID=2841651 RepID=UPI0025E23267|nr:hypothetical protein [Microcoleus sp. CAWBG58]